MLLHEGLLRIVGHWFLLNCADWCLHVSYCWISFYKQGWGLFLGNAIIIDAVYIILSLLEIMLEL
jgi:hypothetical protein